MDAVERRAELRVRPPGDALAAFAVWPAASPAPARLSVAALGRPAASRREGCRLTLLDASSIGLGVELAAPDSALDTLADAPAWFVYLTLRECRPEAEGELLSLFYHAAVARLRPSPGVLAAGLRLTRQGRGCPFDKAIDFFNVTRFGSPDLAAWLDALARAAARPALAAGPGLHLDRLLEEPELSADAPIVPKDAPL
jgi:hypothetical protein